MARLTTVPWPPETHENHRLIVYKTERVTVSLLTLLNEAGEMPPNYEPYKTLLPNMRRRLTEAYEAAVDMSYYVPGVGRPPMWVKLTNKVIKSTGQMLDALDLIEARVSTKEFDTVIKATNVMLDACLELLDGFKKVPLGNDNEDADDEGPGRSNEDDNNSLYLLDFSSLYLKK